MCGLRRFYRPVPSTIPGDPQHFTTLFSLLTHCTEDFRELSATTASSSFYCVCQFQVQHCIGMPLMIFSIDNCGKTSELLCQPCYPLIRFRLQHSQGCCASGTGLHQCMSLGTQWRHGGPVLLRTTLSETLSVFQPMILDSSSRMKTQRKESGWRLGRLWTTTCFAMG